MKKSKVREFLSKHRKIVFSASLVASLIVVFLGGGKLLIYLALLLTGLFVGIRYERFRRIYQDYKLGLQVNSILVSQKQYEKQKEELEQLREDLKHANERINLYKAARLNHAMLQQMEMELEESGYDDQHNNGIARFR